MEKLIKLPRGIGLMVSQILKEQHNIPPRTKNGLLSLEFTEEELSLITHLRITEPVPNTLTGLHLLPALKSLVIVSEGVVTAHMRDKDMPSITDSDIQEIAKCVSLKNLSIINQGKIHYIDVSKLLQLESLQISDNQNIDEILGLKKLSNLYFFECFGNNRLFHIDDLDKCIMQNAHLGDLGLDVLLFPNAINFDTHTKGYNNAVIERLRELSKPENAHVNWYESLLPGSRKISITTPQMFQLHNRACQILTENVSPSAGKRDTIIAIEYYLAKNVRYDIEGVKHGYTHRVQSGINNGFMANGPIGGTNSAYNALVFNSCDCEGFTRAEQYMLKLRGINSHNVDCYALPDNTHMSDSSKAEDKYTVYTMPKEGWHSIICIDDFDFLYSDPCVNATRFRMGDESLPFSLRTKDEISKTHTLSFEERDIENKISHQPKNEIEASLRRIKSFLGRYRTRPSDIDQVRTDIHSKIPGQIQQR